MAVASPQTGGRGVAATRPTAGEKLVPRLDALAGVADVALEVAPGTATAAAVPPGLADFRRRLAAAEGPAAAAPAAGAAPGAEPGGDDEAARKEAKRERKRRIREEKDRRARKKALKAAARAAAGE